MPNWIFVVKSSTDFTKRLEQRKWPIYNRTTNRNRLRAGDNVIFYLAGEDGKKFLGTARLGSGLKKAEQIDYLVDLDDIEIWEKHVKIHDVIEELEFIVYKRNWGVHFQGGVIRLSDKDYTTITTKVKK